MSNVRRSFIGRDSFDALVLIEPGLRSILQELIEFAAAVDQNLVPVFTCLDDIPR